MSTLSELATERIELDPRVACPPFPVSLELPTAFSVLDTHPATWRRSAQVLLRDAFAGDRLAAADRRSALAVLESLVSRCQRAGAALNLVRMGRLTDGRVASSGIHLAWVEEKAPSSLARVWDTLSRNGSTTEVATGLGPALLHRSHANAQVPGTATIVSMARRTLFVPVPDTHWTMILSTGSAFPELTDALDRLFLRIAASVTLADPHATASAELPPPILSSDSSDSSSGSVTRHCVGGPA